MKLFGGWRLVKEIDQSPFRVGCLSRIHRTSHDAAKSDEREALFADQRGS